MKINLGVDYSLCLDQFPMANKCGNIVIFWRFIVRFNLIFKYQPIHDMSLSVFMFPVISFHVDYSIVEQFNNSDFEI